jgi:hypothetical protein
MSNTQFYHLLSAVINLIDPHADLAHIDQIDRVSPL